MGSVLEFKSYINDSLLAALGNSAVLEDAGLA